jgi:ribosome-associated toxin RatA of RatAB toxin-antitoxin module
MNNVCWILVIGGLICSANADEKWDLARNESGIRVYTRKIQGSGFKAFKAVTVLSSSMQDIISLFQDVEHYPEWMDKVDKAELIEQESDSVHIHYLVYGAPFPVSDRDAIYKYSYKARQENDGIIVIIECLPDLRSEENHVRIRKASGYWSLTPVQKDSVGITFMLHMEPGGGIPSWLANKGVVDAPWKTLRNIKDILCNQK